MQIIVDICGRPPCEVVNWKNLKDCFFHDYSSRPPCEVVNWKFCLVFMISPSRASTSLWGRELKVVDLLLQHFGQGRPPCEVVNWKILRVISWRYEGGRPPCEVVNWKNQKSVGGRHEKSRPPCEVVNWKTEEQAQEIRSHVDLLVRSWIERSLICKYLQTIRSTSLWGRELKERRLCVISIAGQSTSLWGRELKVLYSHHLPICRCRPPCEVVNWKNLVTNPNAFNAVDLLVRSWIERLWSRFQSVWSSRRPPCEVVNWKRFVCPLIGSTVRRPPCEVVNWKALLWLVQSGDAQSTSLWGRELKDSKPSQATPRTLSTSLWGRELKDKYGSAKHNFGRSTSLWGRELKV